MNDKRSIQDIIPPARSKPIRESKININTEEKETMNSKLPPRPKRERRSGSMITLLGIALVVILVVGGAFGVVSTVFHRVDITIVPHAFSVTLAESYGASPDGEFLSYSNVTYEETATSDVASTDSEFVEDRAQGQITVYNEYSKTTQRLITNTRFESPEGLIYRVKSPVNVPGYTTSGGEVVPGKVNITVYADEPGEDYNIVASSFSIPGLKGSDQYEEMYAKSVEAMIGGFVGEKAIVDKTVRDAAVSDLKTNLSQKVKNGLKNRLSDSQIYNENLVEVNFVEQPDRATESGAQVAVKAIASGPVFNQNQVAKLIASEGGIIFENPLEIVNIGEISLEITESEDDESLTLNISGTAELQAIFDQEQFVREISGKDQESVGAVLTGYPGIKDLSLSVYPFWRRTLPTKIESFTIKVDE